MKPGTTVHAHAVPASAWRNGGGQVRELLRWPASGRSSSGGNGDNGQERQVCADSDHWQLRISLAEIHADGAFSAYPGVTRWLTVVEGAGLVLDWPGRSHRLQAGGPALCFAGGAAPRATLHAGPVRALNLMLRGVNGRLWRGADADADDANGRTRWPGLCRYDMADRVLHIGVATCDDPTALWLGFDAELSAGPA